MTVTLQRAPSKLRSHLSISLDTTAAALERKQGLCVLLIALLYLPMVLVEAHAHPLRHDELFTWGIARAPSLGAMLERLHTVDLNPPLSYVLERLALGLPGPRWLLSRLPSIAAGLLASETLFLLFARRLSNLFGLFALSIFWVSVYVEYAWQNRPYMLWLAALLLMLLAWSERRAGRRRGAMLVLLTFAAVMALASHILALPSLLTVALATLVGGRRGRGVDWPMLAAVSLLAGVALWLEIGASSQMAGACRTLYPPEFLPHVDSVGWMYVEMVLYFGIAVFACWTVRALLPRSHGPLRSSELVRACPPAADEMVLFGGLALQGLAIAVLFSVRQVAFFPRYGIASIVGVAGLLTWLFYRRIPRATELATLLSVAMVLATVARISVDLFVFDGNGNAGSDIAGPRPPLASSTAGLPLLAASGLTFVEMNDREPAETRARLYYLTDWDAAAQFGHATLFENEREVQQALGLNGQVAGYHDFLLAHQHFYVVGTYTYPEDWLLRKLHADGANLIYRGKFRSSYKDDDLYEVVVPAR